MAVTRDDVARLAGVSPATVSYVINDGPRPVSEDTRTKVLWAIERLGYQPNVMAQNLRRQRTNTVGLVFMTIERHLTHPYFVDLLTSVGEECARHGFDLLLSPCPDRALEQSIYERMVGGRRVAGIIVTGIRHTDARIAYLDAEEFPFVVLGRPERNEDLHYIDVDGARGTDEAVQHLIDLGWQRIALIGLSAELICADDRLVGYRRALERNGLAYDPALVVNMPTTEAAGHQAMTRFLALDEPPDAVLACSDELALGAMNAAQEQGLVVGRDIGVIGFDDIPSAAYCQPPLTTIRQPMYEIGTRLCRMLIQIIEGKEPEERQVVLPPTLIVRESCGAHCRSS
ncbi:MAG TPA: LacI family transcriptional regulator [Anaerolineae bacterium]|nr:LacI family transcriptional regulator [Anaerolineae bacterium]